jgi:hypothetical protein
VWAADGTWERVFTALMAQADADKELDRVVSVDSTIVRAHPSLVRLLTQGSCVVSAGVDRYAHCQTLLAASPL